MSSARPKRTADQKPTALAEGEMRNAVAAVSAEVIISAEEFYDLPDVRHDMRSLKIRVFKGIDTDPETTCTIPTAVLQVAFKLIPRQAMDALREKGIELEEIIKLSENQDVHGTLLEVEDHKKNERVVITLE